MTRQLVRQGTGTHHVVSYKTSFLFMKRYAFWTIKNLYSLSTCILWLSNLTVGESFLKNSFGGRSHCLCAADKAYAALPAGVSLLRHHRTTVGIYLWFFFHHLSNPHPHTRTLIYKYMCVCVRKRKCTRFILDVIHIILTLYICVNVHDSFWM